MRLLPQHQSLMNVTFEVDHILPEKEGGLTMSDNLALSCPLCNGFKEHERRGTPRRQGATFRCFTLGDRTGFAMSVGRKTVRRSKDAPEAGAPPWRRSN